MRISSSWARSHSLVRLYGTAMIQSDIGLIIREKFLTNLRKYEQAPLKDIAAAIVLSRGNSDNPCVFFGLGLIPSGEIVWLKKSNLEVKSVTFELLTPMFASRNLVKTVLRCLKCSSGSRL